MFGSAFSFAGEMGMVSSGTGELDLSVVGAVAEVDMAGGRVTKGRGSELEVSVWRVEI